MPPAQILYPALDPVYSTSRGVTGHILCCQEKGKLFIFSYL